MKIDTSLTMPDLGTFIQIRRLNVSFSQSERMNIRERWEDRVVANRWHENHRAEEGVSAYLKRYGRNIGQKKVMQLAVMAEDNGADLFALHMWMKAYELEFGRKPLSNPFDMDAATWSDEPAILDETLSEVDRLFPPGFQPGRFVPAQPADAAYERDYYISLVRYLGQPKRNGHKMIIFVAGEKVWYQNRSRKLRDAPSPEFEEALKKCAPQLNPWALEGELFYRDVSGQEWKTDSEATHRNNVLGQPDVEVLPVFSPFGCIVWDGKPVTKKRDQIEKAEGLIDLIDSPMFEQMPTFRTHAEKRQLSRLQKERNLEGEIWFRYDYHYQHGKVTASSDEQYDYYVRTKYQLDPMKVRISTVKAGTADGHAIAGFSMEDENGNDIGSCGTGYTREDQLAIRTAWSTCPDDTWAMVTARAWTAYGKLEMAVFQELL